MNALVLHGPGHRGPGQSSWDEVPDPTLDSDPEGVSGPVLHLSDRSTTHGSQRGQALDAHDTSAAARGPGRPMVLLRLCP